MIDPPSSYQWAVVTEWSSLSAEDQMALASLYARVFAAPPYREAFTDEGAADAVRRLFSLGGVLAIMRDQGGAIAAFAGGYPKNPDVFFIEELGVDPSRQGLGLGRAMINALLSTTSSYSGWELRTERHNSKALKLYGSLGFELKGVTEVVPQNRTGGSVSLDSRVYLVKGARRPVAFHRLALAYPSGNATAILFDQLMHVDARALNEDVTNRASAIQGVPPVEQCGFITTPRMPTSVARLQMFGGEFCGNALRSAAWLVMRGADSRGQIECSGVEKPLGFEIESGVVSLEMPVVVSKSGPCTQRPDGIEVELSGITHLVQFPSRERRTPEAREVLQSLLNQPDSSYASLPALGVSQFEESSRSAQFAVWVRDVNTIFDETACGSGTAAIAMALAWRAGSSTKVDVVQPSGRVISGEAHVEPGAGVTRASIAGNVEILFDGEVSK